MASDREMELDVCPNAPDGYNGTHSEAWWDDEGPCEWCGNDDRNCPSCGGVWPSWWMWAHMLAVAINPAHCDVTPEEVER